MMQQPLDKAHVGCDARSSARVARPRRRGALASGARAAREVLADLTGGVAAAR
ncbi:hypothetical protein [Kitasatospora aureofaciens]|uniref:hypothetical protein n=1 Tax=Kitasatospora aureofaciens TaxID=1894 RepID=UPI0037CA22B0